MARTIDPIIDPDIARRMEDQMFSASEASHLTATMDAQMLGTPIEVRGGGGGANLTATEVMAAQRIGAIPADFSGGINSPITEPAKRRTRSFKVGDVVRVMQNLHGHCDHADGKVSKIVKISGSRMWLDSKTACTCFFEADELRLEKDYVDPRIGIIKK